jgi:AraC-like DNA-binding protein
MSPQARALLRAYHRRRRVARTPLPSDEQLARLATDHPAYPDILRLTAAGLSLADVATHVGLSRSRTADLLRRARRALAP